MQFLVAQLQVIDFEEWYFNITEADSNPSNPMWKQLYASVNQEYGLKSQVPSEWNNMIERMKTDDALFEKYRKNYYRRSKYDGVGSCDSNCRKGWMCNARKMHHSQKLCADLGGEQAKRSTYRKSIKPVFRNKQEIMKFYAKWRTTRANDKCPI
uniref:ASMase_C domain-containing protein n=1 Tax=Heterorhabditis bacteriophora TaxID=37862 RepID=A0A1I7XVH7_HETBA